MRTLAEATSRSFADPWPLVPDGAAARARGPRDARSPFGPDGCAYFRPSVRTSRMERPSSCTGEDRLTQLGLLGDSSRRGRGARPVLVSENFFGSGKDRASGPPCQGPRSLYRRTMLQVLANGIVQGAVLALVAISLTIIFSIPRVPHFGLGGIFVWGAFAGFFARQAGAPF